MPYMLRTRLLVVIALLALIVSATALPKHRVDASPGHEPTSTPDPQDMLNLAADAEKEYNDDFFLYRRTLRLFSYRIFGRKGSENSW